MAALSMSRGLLFGLLAAFFWGTHSVIVRYLTEDMGGLQIAAIRLLIAAFAIYVILRIMREPISVRLSDWNFRLAVLSTVVNYIFFHIGLEYTGAANAMVLENTAPLFVLIFLYFFAKAPLSVRDVLAVALAVLGVVLTVLPDLQEGDGRIQGDLLELAAGVSWAVFLISSSRAMLASNSTGERLNFLFGVFVCSGLLMAPMAMIDPVMPSAENAVFLILLGVFPTALAYYLWYEAAARVSTLSATLMFALSVVFTFINAAVFLGAEVSLLAIAGGALIVLAVVLTSTEKSTKAGALK
ncbi:MAG: DMT family transporter [Pseudomonadota bacterium]